MNYIYHPCFLQYIIYVGRLAKEKRMDTILKAVSNLKGEWQLNVYGDGEEAEKLVEMCYDLYML